MGRKPRIDIPDYVYHITARGNYRQNIFLNEDDKGLYLDILALYQAKYAFELYSFVLMDNHVHLLLKRPQETALSKIVKSLHSTYAREHNFRIKRHGHLFQGRFHAIVVENDSYLLELSRYIHLNPVRAGMVSDPAAYPFSSAQTYLGYAYMPYVNKMILTGLAKRPKTQQERYRRFLLEGIAMGKGPLADVKEGLFLGSDEFVSSIRQIGK